VDESVVSSFARAPPSGRDSGIGRWLVVGGAPER
jgi:hypothetical protein